MRRDGDIQLVTIVDHAGGGETGAVAKMLQSVYHQLNTKARKYEPLAPEERLKWEAYYAADQEELSQLLRNLQVID